MSLLGDIQSLSRHGYAQLAVGGPPGAGGLEQMTFSGLFQPRPFTDGPVV